MVNRQLKRIARSYGVTKRVVAVSIAAAITMGFSSTHEVITSCEAYAASYAVVQKRAQAHRIDESGKSEIYTRLWEERANEKRKIRTINGKVIWDTPVSPGEKPVRSDYGYFVRGYPDVPSTVYTSEDAYGWHNQIDVVVTAQTRAGLRYRLRADQYKQCMASLYRPTPAYEWYGIVLSTEIIEENEEKWPIALLAKNVWTTLYNRCSSVLRLTWLDTTESSTTSSTT